MKILKNPLVIIIIVLTVAAVVLGIMLGVTTQQHKKAENSYADVLRAAGLEEGKYEIVDSGTDSDGNPYRVLVRQFGDQYEARAAYLTQVNDCWQLDKLVDQPLELNGWLEMSWSNVVKMELSGVDGTSYEQYEVHKVFCGKNAYQTIEIPAEMLPSNVTVQILQIDEYYMLHFISYGGENALDAITAESFYNFLVGSRYIVDGT